MSEKIIDKLRKLLKLQKSAQAIGSLHEAELVAERIQGFLDKYNLSMSQIEIEEQEKIGVEHEKILKDFKRVWKRRIIRAFASTNSCDAIYDPPLMLLIGHQVDRLLVLELFTYFSDLGEELATIAQQKIKREYGYTPSQFRGSYMLGYADAISYRIVKQHRDSMKAQESTSTAMIFIGDKISRVKEYVEKNIPTKMRMEPGSANNREAYELGHKAGSDVALTNKRFGRDD